MTDIFPYDDYDTSSVSGESDTSEDDNINEYEIDSNGQYYISIPNGNGSIKLYHPSNDNDPIHISYNDNSYISIMYNDTYDIIYHNDGSQIGYIYWPASIIVFPEYI